MTPIPTSPITLAPGETLHVGLPDSIVLGDGESAVTAGFGTGLYAQDCCEWCQRYYPGHQSGWPSRLCLTMTLVSQDTFPDYWGGSWFLDFVPSGDGPDGIGGQWAYQLPPECTDAYGNCTCQGGQCCVPIRVACGSRQSAGNTGNCASSSGVLVLGDGCPFGASGTGAVTSLTIESYNPVSISGQFTFTGAFTGHLTYNFTIAECPASAVAPRLAAAAPGHPAAAPTLGGWDYITTARMVRDTGRLLAALPPDIDRVVGIARSGLLPASLIATQLHVPLGTVSQSRYVADPGHGRRLFGPDSRSPKHVLLVDDTAARGHAMKAAVPLVQSAFPGAKVTRAVVYCHPIALPFVDLYAAVYPGMHYLEWNWPNAGHGQGCAYDFDGILCEECPVGDDDDGPRYLRFLEGARPLFLPRRTPIPMIVTARHEKYRQQTLDWLARHGVRVQSLVMRGWEYDPTRTHDEQAGAWKAWVYDRSPLKLFAESSPRQAEIINANTGKAVLCPAAERVFPPKPKAPKRIALCLHVGRRTESRPGCNGWMCRHDCDKGHPDAVPGGNCQDCPDYEADDAGGSAAAR